MLKGFFWGGGEGDTGKAGCSALSCTASPFSASPHPKKEKKKKGGVLGEAGGGRHDRGEARAAMAAGRLLLLALLLLLLLLLGGTAGPGARAARSRGSEKQNSLRRAASGLYQGVSGLFGEDNVRALQKVRRRALPLHPHAASSHLPLLSSAASLLVALPFVASAGPEVAGAEHRWRPPPAGARSWASASAPARAPAAAGASLREGERAGGGSAWSKRWNRGDEEASNLGMGRPGQPAASLRLNAAGVQQHSSCRGLQGVRWARRHRNSSAGREEEMLLDAPRKPLEAPWCDDRGLFQLPDETDSLHPCPFLVLSVFFQLQHNSKANKSYSKILLTYRFTCQNT